MLSQCRGDFCACCCEKKVRTNNGVGERGRSRRKGEKGLGNQMPQDIFLNAEWGWMTATVLQVRSDSETKTVKGGRFGDEAVKK